jgi:hypothetical protein
LDGCSACWDSTTPGRSSCWHVGRKAARQNADGFTECGQSAATAVRRWDSFATAQGEAGFSSIRSESGTPDHDLVRSIEFVASEKTIGKGYGGKNEDDEYYPIVANI